MSNDTDYKLIFGHPKREYLEQVMNHLIEKKERYEQKKPEEIPLQQHLKDLGLNRPADFVSWGFSFGEITKESSLHKVEASTWANENSSNVHITGEDGELASLLNVFPELNISGSYRDEYSAGSVQGHEKIQEQSREEVDAEEAEWGDDNYSEATKTLLNKTYHGPLSLKEARQLIEQGADLNASMNGTCFGGMLADPGWELYNAIPEFLEKGMEMRTIRYLHANLARILAQKYVTFELDGLFHLETDVAEILVDEVSKRSTPKDGKEWKQELGSNWFWCDLFQEGPFLSLDLQEVSEDLARILIQFPGKLNFQKLREIPKSLAKILAQHVGTLSLGISHEIDEELASILSTHQGILVLRDFGAWSEGVIELSEKAALEIGKHKGPLCFTGLRTISSKAAAGLAKNIYGLHFQDLGWWDSKGADPNDLKDNQGNSYRFELPDETLSQLMRCPGEIYIGIDHLNEKRAEFIAANTGHCWMDNYRRSLQPEIARILVKKKGGLGLNAITELSDEVCEILSDFKGTLNLDGLEKTGLKGLQFLKVIWDAPEPATLDCPLVEEFAKKNALEKSQEKQDSVFAMSFYYAEGETPQGPFSAAHILSLKSLGKISDETYVIQAGGTEWTTFAALQPTLKSLLPGPVISSQSPRPNSVAVATPIDIEKEASPAKLYASPTKAAALGPNASFTEQMLALARDLDTPEQRHKRLAAGLRSIFELEEEFVIKFVKGALANSYRGSLDLCQLSSISKELADLLAQYPTTGVREHKIVNGVAEEHGDDETLELTGLDELTPEVAKCLGRHKGWLVLGGFQEFSKDSAEAISIHEGRLGLGHLEELSEEAAAALSKHRYTLNLNGLGEISPQIASFLSKRNPIEKDVSLLLSPSEVSVDTAQALAAGTEKLVLGEMETISNEALSAFSTRKGPVHFDGFQYLSPEAIEIFKSGKYPHLEVLGLEDIEVRE